MRQTEKQTVTNQVEVVFCDDCGAKVGCYQCEICGKDVCRGCAVRFDSCSDLSHPNFSGDRPGNVVCRECWEKGEPYRLAIEDVRQKSSDAEEALFAKWRERKES